jgi:ABC-type nitrate/sulfonate/bicarbonate transport system permease component
LIAAELHASTDGRLGYLLALNASALELAGALAAIIAIILIGLLVEATVFRTVEQVLLRRQDNAVGQ